jgi:NADPH-dependent ferric siderophore reductase
MTTDSTVSRVQRVRHELKRRTLEVARVATITPHFRSVVFRGESLVDFVSASFDDHVKFILDPDGPNPVMRDYTPRHFDRDARELTIEFALHGDGPVADWAAHAGSGQVVTIGGPRGSMIVPTDFDWHLLAGDETALPAIARRLEELPAGSRVCVFAQIDDPADRRDFPGVSDPTIRWLDTPDALVDAVRSFALPAGEGHAWCAGEAATMATLRRILVDEKGHDRHAIRAAAYWKRGAVAYHDDLD